MANRVPYLYVTCPEIIFCCPNAVYALWVTGVVSARDNAFLPVFPRFLNSKMTLGLADEIFSNMADLALAQAIIWREIFFVKSAL